MDFKSFQNRIFKIGQDNFIDLALEVFRYQANHNPVYRIYLETLGRDPGQVKQLEEVPFLPITFFRNFAVKTGQWEPEVIFESSGTTGSLNLSKHFLKDLPFYHRLAHKGFESFYGSLKDYHIFALLPGYLERQNSSLVSMVDHFMQVSGSEYGGFFLNDFEALKLNFRSARKKGNRKILLLGVTFALLDLAESWKEKPLKEMIVMETGGMKGRREEIIREEVHSILSGTFGVETVHSEYGMTEMLSQAYSKGGGLFQCPPWFRVLIREPNDPFNLNFNRRNGGLNLIDLGNLYSCSFIQTDDLGKIHPDQTFEVSGRMDQSDIRGCNLLYL